MSDFRTMTELLTRSQMKHTSSKVNSEMLGHWLKVEPKARFMIHIPNSPTSTGRPFGFPPMACIFLFDANGRLIVTGAYA